MKSLITATLCALLGLAPAAIRAETITTPIGSLVVPEGLQILERDEKPDPKTGKPGGLIVFSKAKDLPRAVFIVSWSYVEPSDKPFDALEATVKIGNPFNKSLTRQNATVAKLGSVEGGRYEGLLPNGLRAISYMAANGPLRLLVLLKGPATSPYKELANDFARGVEAFEWNMPDTGTAPAPATPPKSSP